MHVYLFLIKMNTFTLHMSKQFQATNEHKKYLCQHANRLTDTEQINLLKTFIVRRGYKSLLSQSSDGIYIDLNTIDDPELIKSMYLHVTQLLTME